MIVERRVGDRSLRAQCSADEAAARHVLDAFERLDAAGTPLCAGTQIRFGWSLLSLTDDPTGDEGSLRVMEPDFARWPDEHWVASIDVTLRVIASQVGLLHRLGVDGDDAGFDQKIIAVRGTVSQPGIYLRRTSPISPDDSGWLLATVQDPEALARDNAIEALFIASLVERRPALLQALALPAGFIAIFSGDVLDQVLDGAGRPLLPAQGSDTP